MSLTRTAAAITFVSITCLTHAFGEPGRVAFTHVNVVPMDREVVLDDMTVLVEGERIAGIFPSSAIAAPEDAEMIDGTGKFLLPGLMDMHVHFDDPDGPALFARHGVTTIRVMGGSDEILAASERVRRGELFGPLIVSATPPFAHSAEGEAYPVTDAASAREGVRKFASMGYEWVKVIRLSDETLEATVDEAKRHGLSVGGHLRFDPSLESFVGAGVNSVEHFEEAMWTAFGSTEPSEAEMREVARGLREARVTMSTLLWTGLIASDMRTKGEGALETPAGRALAAYLGEEQVESSCGRSPTIWGSSAASSARRTSSTSRRRGASSRGSTTKGSISWPAPTAMPSSASQGAHSTTRTERGQRGAGEAIEHSRR